MTTSAKRQFKRFQGFYQNGQLQPHFIQALKEKFEREESGVIKTWFDYCEEQYGKVEQPSLIAGEILEQSVK